MLLIPVCRKELWILFRTMVIENRYVRDYFVPLAILLLNWAVLCNDYPWLAEWHKEHCMLSEHIWRIEMNMSLAICVIISVLCKICEKLHKKALLLFLTETRSLSPSQHGFLPRRSCLSNLILQEERVTRLLDEGHTVHWRLPASMESNAKSSRMPLRSRGRLSPPCVLHPTHGLHVLPEG